MMDHHAGLTIIVILLDRIKIRILMLSKPGKVALALARDCSSHTRTEAYSTYHSLRSSDRTPAAGSKRQ